MRLMSFYATTEQMRNRTKSVTRRTGWKFAKPGDRVLAVEKARGVMEGNRKTIGIIEFVRVDREPLCELDPMELALEGFPGITGAEFVAKFCKLNPGIAPGDEITRIQFRFL